MKWASSPKRKTMSPMSLLTLPAGELRDMSAHDPLPSPHGERGERRYALTLVLALLSAMLVAVLIH